MHETPGIDDQNIKFRDDDRRNTWDGVLIRKPDRLLTRNEEKAIISDKPMVGAVTDNESLDKSADNGKLHQTEDTSPSESFRTKLTRLLNEWIGANPGRVFYTVNGCYENAEDYFLHILTIRGVNKQVVTEEEVEAELKSVKASSREHGGTLREVAGDVNRFLSQHDLPTLDMSLGHVHFVTDAQAASEFKLTPSVDRAAKIDGHPDVLVTESAIADPNLLRVSIVHEAMHVARDAAGLFQLTDSKIIEEGFNHEATKAMLKEHKMTDELDLAKQIYHIETWIIRKLCARLQLNPITCSHDVLRQKLQENFYMANDYNHPYQDLEDDIVALTRLWDQAEDNATDIVAKRGSITSEIETELLLQYTGKLAEISSRWQLEPAVTPTPPRPV